VPVVRDEAVERRLGAGPREVLEAVAGRPGELGLVARTSGDVEADAAVLAPHVDEPPPEARAVDAHAALRDRARHLAQSGLVLLALAVKPERKCGNRNQE
jgi:hypothetical protein